MNREPEMMNQMISHRFVLLHICCTYASGVTVAVIVAFVLTIVGIFWLGHPAQWLQVCLLLPLHRNFQLSPHFSPHLTSNLATAPSTLQGLPECLPEPPKAAFLDLYLPIYLSFRFLLFFPTFSCLECTFVLTFFSHFSLIGWSCCYRGGGTSCPCALCWTVHCVHNLPSASVSVDHWGR